MLLKLLPFIAILPATAYSLLSLWCGRRFFAQTASFIAKSSPAVTIIKPVKGMDEGSYENFASFCRQKYSAPVQLLFAVASEDDPVLPVIKRLIADFPAIDIHLSVNPAIHGPNYKVSNLINAFPKASYDIIIICDSDIRVEPGFLKSVTAHFDNPAVGLVTSPYRSSRVHGAVTAIEALAFTGEMIPNVLVARQLEGLSFALGASMAVKREALEQIGGLDALVNYLADDYQLGNKIHLAGWQIVLDSNFVESMMKQERLSDLLSRQLRWARTMRVSRPGGYLASGITLPGLAIILALLAWQSANSLLAVLLLCLVRICVSSIFSQLWVRDRLLPRWCWLLPFRDLLATVTWLLAFLGNKVTWRGHRFKIRPDGTMEQQHSNGED